MMETQDEQHGNLNAMGTFRRARAMPNSDSTRNGYLLCWTPGTSEQLRARNEHAIIDRTGRCYSMWQKDLDAEPMSALTSSVLMLPKSYMRRRKVLQVQVSIT